MSILRLALITLSAWTWRSFISVLIPFFSTQGIENETFRALLEFAASFVFLWLIFSAIPPLFTWLLPAYNRYEPTRFNRRVQGLTLMFSLFLIPTLIILVLSSIAHFEQTIDNWHQYDDFTSRSQAREFLNYRLKAEPYSLFYELSSKTINGGKGLFVIIILAVICAALLSNLQKPLHRILTPIIRYFEKGRFGRGGSGRFATFVEEWGYDYAKIESNNKILVGKSLYNPSLWIGIEDTRHMLTVGGSRGGKGVAAVIPNLLRWRGSAVVIDPKGRNTDITAKQRKKYGNVYIIDPSGSAENYADTSKDSLNPFDYLDVESDTIREDIDILAEALVIRNPSAKEPHWDEKAIEIISGFIGHAITTEEKPHLGHVADYVYTVGNDRDALLQAMYLNEAIDGLMQETAADIIESGDSDELKSILSSVKKNVKWLRIAPLRRTLETSTFDIDDLKKQSTTLYIVAKTRYARLNRLLINLITSRMQKPPISNVDVLCIMDEFLSMGYMHEIATGISVLAEYHLILWPIVQEMTSLSKTYNGNISPFITNSRAVQMFALGDEEAKEYATGRLGPRPLQSVLGVLGGNQRVPFRSPDEVEKEINKDDKLQYVFITGRAPLLLDKIIYHKTGSLKKLADRDPSYG